MSKWPEQVIITKEREYPAVSCAMAVIGGDDSQSDEMCDTVAADLLLVALAQMSHHWKWSLDSIFDRLTELRGKTQDAVYH